MERSLPRTDRDIEAVYLRNVDAVFHICYSFMKSREEAEDAVSDTFVRLISAGKEFESAGHERAWLIVTAENICRNRLRHWWRRTQPLDENIPDAETQPESVTEAVRRLPERFRTSIYLYYYEGLDGAEIARMLGKNPATVRSWLKRGRDMLRKELGEDFEK